MKSLFYNIFHSFNTGNNGFSLKKELAAISTLVGLLGAAYVIYKYPQSSDMPLGIVFGYAAGLLGIGAYQSNVRAKLDSPAMSSKSTDGMGAAEEIKIGG